MSKRLVTVLGAAMLLFALSVVASSQVPTTTVTKTQVTQNPDGTYTVVEYPVGKETVVTLSPVGLSGATGTATILRSPDNTTIKLNLTSLPKEVTSMNAYAVDPDGVVVPLGPIEIANGKGTFTTSAPLTSFMLIASPDDAITAYNANTKIFFRSSVPAGLAVIPLAASASGEKVAAVAVPTEAVVTPTEQVVVPKEPVVTPTETVVVPKENVVSPTADVAVAVATGDYTVPMLGIPSFKRGDDTKMKINFSGTMEGSRANVFIEPHKNGKMTEVRMHFHELKEAPKGLAYILWAVSSDNQFTQVGQIVNYKGRNEAEIKGEVSFDDFGLLLTTEDLGMTKGTIIKPSGQRVGVIQIVP
jgi:hypothetical protein